MLSNVCTLGKCGAIGTITTPLKVTTPPKPTTPSTTPPTTPPTPPAPNPACQQVKALLTNAKYSSDVIAKVMAVMSCP